MKNAKDIWRVINTNRLSFLTIIGGLLIAALSSQGNISTDRKLDFILGLVLLLTIAEVFERSQQLFDVQEKIDDATQKLEFEIAKRFSVKYLIGETEIVREINRLQEQDLFNHLRTVIYEVPKSPEAVTNKLIELLIERKDLSIAITTVLLLNPKSLTAEFFKQADARVALYKKNGVNMKQVKFLAKIVEPPIGVDMYIIDKKHVIFNITDMGKEGVFYRAVLIENQPEIAGAYIDWFERNVVPDTISLVQLKGYPPSGSKS